MTSPFILTVTVLLLLGMTTAKEEVDLLFILHDAGESNFLKPAIDVLLETGVISFTILTLGEPSTAIFSEYEQEKTLVDFGIDISIEDGTSDRSQILSDQQIQDLVSQLQPKVVIEGCVYQMQAQMGVAFGNEYNNTTVVAVTDSFALWDDKSICSKFFTQPGAVNECFLCADQQVSGVELDNANVIPTVTGSPTLQEWQSIAENRTYVASTRATLYSGMHAHDSSQSVLVAFAGGYGLPGSSYDQALLVFCHAVNSAPAKYEFVFTPHPGYPSSYEAAIFAENGCADGVFIVPDEADLSSAAVFSAANATMSACSTTGGQSLAIGIPHLYITGHNSTNGDAICRDVFTETELIRSVDTAHGLLEVLDDMGNSTPPYFIPPSSIVEAGVPLGATKRVVARLQELL